MLPDLDSLALFVRAAEQRNLTRAAEVSFITVPAASRRLSLLEHQFKAQLFERHSRGLELTAAGERLLVLATVHHMRAEMTNYGSGHTAVLRIHGNTSAMAQFLPADIASFQPLRPDIRLVLEECWSADAIRKLRSGDIDLGVVVEGVDTAGLVTLPYRQDQLAVVAPPSIPLPEPVFFSDLLEHDMVGLEGGSTLTRLLEARATELMKPMALRVQVRSFEAVCRAVEAGLGIGVLPMQAARGTAQSMNLRVLPIADAWASRRMLLCTGTVADPGSPLGALLAHLQTCVQLD
ncbi:LysR family transcriptional regulator [Hydrogenophaga sp.]|uniref:LysR family transcriptional regulator n=1 Tax=Hydrogenophaga sp. TaxID=1904254 RepID=UPI003AF71EEE